MGTRADFYVGRGKEAEWIGSIAWDGYPDGVDELMLRSITEDMYRKRVQSFLESRDDATFPEMGWPWPWDDSRTTDYAYAFDGGGVYASGFGGGWFLATSKESDPKTTSKTAEFPDMSDRKNISFGKNSGLITIS